MHHCDWFDKKLNGQQRGRISRHRGHCEEGGVASQMQKKQGV